MRTLSSFILHPSAFILLLPCLCLAGPRDRRLMDFGWKFHVADASLPGEASTPLSHWRWTPVEGAPPSTPPSPDATWKDATPNQDVFAGRVGYAWFSTELPDVKASDGAGRVVVFEAVDDNATVFLNGHKIGSHEGWSESFEVPLDPAPPGVWNPAGPNVLTVLVENTAGIGGLKSATLRRATAAVAAPDFDDSAWRTVDVPHDFLLEQPLDPTTDANFGFHAPAVAWYRRHFTPPPPATPNQRTWLEFDGVYRDAKIYLNGRLLGAHPSGYTSFYFDATDYLLPNKENVLALRVDATSHEGWWYEGGGIYRHVWLTTLSPLHIAHWGTHVTTSIPSLDSQPVSSPDHSERSEESQPSNNRTTSPLAPSPGTPGEGRGEGSAPPATVTLKTSISNQSPSQADFTLRTQIFDADNNIVASTETPCQATLATATQTLSLPTAHLWSPDHPYLYHVLTTLLQGSKELDQVTTPLGIRHIRFDPDHGFFLNGSPLKIKGTCNHQDFAGVGIALPDRLHEYKIEKLKEMGSNAYRCSHHQPAEEILDACDRLGLLVMDENRHLGESDKILDEAATLVLRDRNHPSIILWSICNEEAQQGTEAGRRKAQAIKDVFNKYDGTRPVTAAMQASWGDGISHVIDIQGFNYFPEQYDPYHASHPNQPLIGSETGSILTTRSEYKQDDIRGYVSSYNDGAERTWKPIAQRDFMAGAFVWTGFDYRGEPTPFGWPNLNSHFGIMDTCGFPKDDYYYYQSAWSDKPTLHLLPHWNFAYPRRGLNEPNSQIEIRCYTNCDQVELFVNGTSQGTKSPYPPIPNSPSSPSTQHSALSPQHSIPPAPSHLTWKVKWNPGSITAKGTKDGKQITTTLYTASDPASIQLTPDRPSYLANGEDVILLSARLLDASNHPVPLADAPITFTVTSGDARLLGTGNGDPSDHTPDLSPTRPTFHGRCLALLRTGTHPGPITLTASSPNLPPTTLHLTLQPANPRPTLP